MDVKEFLRRTHKEVEGLTNPVFLQVRPRLKLKSGFEVSMQAGYGLYSSPREALKSGDYSKVELGFPNEVEESLLEYAENESTPLDTIYAYVPVSIVNDLIIKHGGIVNEFDN